MITFSPSLRRTLAFVVLLGCSAAASAHPGHNASGMASGLAHPFGLDHMLAMLAVGIWSVSALPENKSWWGPAAFMTALGLSALAGASGITVPYVEQMVALSVVLFGVLLLAARSRTSTSVGLMLVVAAGTVHGLAHGSESPANGFAAYAVGFMLTTAALHSLGMLASLGLRQYMASKATLITQMLGLLLSGSGVFLIQSV